MSSEPIELTEAELDAAAAVFKVPGGMAFQGRRAYICESIRSINRVLAGDPVGTIRRLAVGHVAVRIGSLGGDRWRVTWSDGTCTWSAIQGVSDWPVIYSPEES